MGETTSGTGAPVSQPQDQTEDAALLNGAWAVVMAAFGLYEAKLVAGYDLSSIPDYDEAVGDALRVLLREEARKLEQEADIRLSAAEVAMRHLLSDDEDGALASRILENLTRDLQAEICAALVFSHGAELVSTHADFGLGGVS